MLCWWKYTLGLGQTFSSLPFSCGAVGGGRLETLFFWWPKTPLLLSSLQHHPGVLRAPPPPVGPGSALGSADIWWVASLCLLKPCLWSGLPLLVHSGTCEMKLTNRKWFSVHSVIIDIYIHSHIYSVITVTRRRKVQRSHRDHNCDSEGSRWGVRKFSSVMVNAYPWFEDRCA